MTTTTYTYETKKGLNIETFTSNGYITLTRNGQFVYENHFGSLTLKLQEQLLQEQFEIHDVKFTKTIN